MKLNTSYKQILSISVPIMLGSAAQNIIVLTDNIFLYHTSSLEFAAVGVVGVFYLVIAAIGYGFSRGGQIVIARRHGEMDYKAVGDTFKSLLFFELIVAIGIFIFLQLGSNWFFGLFINNADIYQKCLEYIYPRSFGVFFSYVGLAFVALYTGIARTSFIIFDTILLILVNVTLNYIFIFGKFGIEPMGIAGAAWASTIAEIVAFTAFIIYIFSDKLLSAFSIFRLDRVKLPIIKDTFSISQPIVWQALIGPGSWFIFYTLVENLGTKELEISNLIRNIYLFLSIPCWGFSAGINTLVSNLIGNRKRFGVIPIIKKTAILNLSLTLFISVPVLMFPEFFLYPFYGKEEMILIEDTKPFMFLLLIIMALFSVGSTFINGLTGTGHTITALWIQSLFSVVYVVYSVIVIKHLSLNLHWAWASEIFYWVGVISVSYWYLKSNQWFEKKF